jgi:hypothetical protein
MRERYVSCMEYTQIFWIYMHPVTSYLSLFRSRENLKFHNISLHSAILWLRANYIIIIIIIIIIIAIK